MITIQTPFHIAMAPFEAGRIGIITKIKEFCMYRGLNGAEPVTSPEILLQEAEKPELEDCHNSLLHLVSLLTWTPHCVYLSVAEAPSPVGGGELGHREDRGGGGLDEVLPGEEPGRRQEVAWEPGREEDGGWWRSC